MNRRQTLIAVLGLTAAALAAPGIAPSAVAAAEIKVLNWKGYGTDEAFATADFEKKTGIKVLHDYFTSEQEMLTKLRTSPGAYDVVLVNSTYLAQAREEGLVQAVDPAAITNLPGVSKPMLDDPSVTVEGKLWGVPWVWGATSFAYNTETIKEPITSIAALWDPKFAGRISFRDDAILAVNLAALLTGQDINQPADMAVIKEKLVALKPQIRSFWASEDEWMKGMASKSFDIGVIWAGGAARAVKLHNLPVEFVIPTEGAVGWFDTLTVAAGAPNPEGAQKFIDYMIDPDFYATWDNTSGAPVSANAAAVAKLPETAYNRAVLGKPEVVGRLKFMQPVPEEKRQEIQELWAEVKTEYAQ
ncbi:ABC transporter substrate-binding protein [Oharaeibacter diazotrophicus]|uniref:Spermidine/putrescine transport system substrate-binding protein n=1 Tax=Oharaeibacter diazotrophicus TaxID=1920512 RepID=A0A4R6R6H7_9HYPH|nr:extracellular solute-binding protein [Oharaeibacter diazotrophicus]TDP81156.1 spermidine/putrescine transport system substrate-binding protein [Oharaeibacter diazotrophicus]BBE74850.1 spermidine/putrescine-binding periplasmic protein precursor [Pleomorphomonas sp. SM30]GLS75646.1 spermidine/putrescine ABC transporter substrate-binding protein [Oharaeibacter diazotrophicus]